MTRFTRTLTPDQLKQMISAVIFENNNEISNINEIITHSENLKGQDMLVDDLMEHPALRVASHNGLWPASTEHPMNELIGITTIGHVTAYGVLLGMYDHPLYYGILYADNRNRLRFYAPVSGNAINPINHQPFGVEQLADDMIAQHIGQSAYKDINPEDINTLGDFFDVDLLKAEIMQNIPHI